MTQTLRDQMSGSAQTQFQPDQVDQLQNVSYVPSLWGSTLCPTCNTNEVGAGKQCKACYNKAYYQAHRDKQIAYQRAYREAHKAKLKAVRQAKNASQDTTNLPGNPVDASNSGASEQALLKPATELVIHVHFHFHNASLSPKGDKAGE